MTKDLYYVYAAIFLASPFIATFIALTIGKKFNLFTISKRYPIYVIFLGAAYYGAFFFGDYAIPMLNTYIYSMDAKAMGPIGILQDYCIPLIFAVPAYILANKLFDVRTSGKGKGVSSFLLYYSLNFVSFLLAMEPFSRKVY
jgi:hypothetical protein